jgi:RNA polymerase sigma-70 factor (ECF subfamily)
MSEQPPAITQLLQRWGDGDESAFDTLASVVYPELRRIAAARMRGERPGHTLQTTAIVNELFVRLMTDKQPDFKNRSQFYAVAARLIRQILVDYARRKATAKRGRRPETVSLDDVAVLIEPHGVDMLALDEALRRLEAVSKRKVEVFELRFFAGFSDEEIAKHLNVTAMTVNRDFRAAKAWVAGALSGG